MKLFYVDPMSYNNLSKYDKALLNNIPMADKVYFCNSRLDCIGHQGVKIQKIFNYSDKKGAWKEISYIKSMLLVIWKIYRKVPDIVHFQWFKSPAFDYLMILIIKKTTRTKIVFTAHNVLPHDTGYKFKKIYCKIYQASDSIIVHTNRTKLEIVSRFHIQKEKISVIPHGVLTVGNIESRPSKKTKTDLIEFLFFGNLANYKGIDLLVEAWQSSSILFNCPNIHLTIAGRGEVDFKQIKQCKNVTIVNRFIEEHEVVNIIRRSDVVILPYRKISQSGVLMSVIKYKKAVIVSNVGGLTEPFEMGDIGWIIERLNVACLRETLEKAAKSRKKIQTIQCDEKTWLKIQNHYSWESIGNKTIDTYLKIL